MKSICTKNKEEPLEVEHFFFAPDVSRMIILRRIIFSVFYFIPGIGGFVVSILNVNAAVAYFNIAVGIIWLIIAFMPNRATVAEN